jgi:hypothetical protein
MTEELREKASPGNPGIKWVQAENRTRPDEVYAQTGFAQGSAGIGLLFLKMFAVTGGNNDFKPLTLPDSPFMWK